MLIVQLIFILFANILLKEDKMSAINLCVVGLANKFMDSFCNKLSINFKTTE